MKRSKVKDFWFSFLGYVLRKNQYPCSSWSGSSRRRI